MRGGLGKATDPHLRNLTSALFCSVFLSVSKLSYLQVYQLQCTQRNTLEHDWEELCKRYYKTNTEMGLFPQNVYKCTL